MKDSWTKFEGTHAMLYSGSNSNDWLITPTFDVVATKNIVCVTTIDQVVGVQQILKFYYQKMDQHLLDLKRNY